MAVDALARAIAAGKTPVTAYDEAVKAGYTGTEEQFAQDMGNSGTNAANAAASASAAAASAESVAASAAQIATNTSDISDLKTQSNVLPSHVINWSVNASDTYPLGWRAARWDISDGTSSYSPYYLRTWFRFSSESALYNGEKLFCITPPNGYWIMVQSWDSESGEYLGVISPIPQEIDRPFTWVFDASKRYGITIGRFENADSENYLTEDFLKTCVLTGFYSAAPNTIEHDIELLNNDITKINDILTPETEIFWQSNWERGYFSVSTGEPSDQSNYYIRTKGSYTFPEYVNTIRAVIPESSGYGVRIFEYDSNDTMIAYYGEFTPTPTPTVEIENTVGHKYKFVCGRFADQTSSEKLSDETFMSTLRLYELKTIGIIDKKERSGDFEWFSVNVDRPLVFGDEGISPNTESIECVLRLPTTYTSRGTPTRLILACHGAHGYIDANNDVWYNSNWKAFMDALLSAGYAVFDANILPTSTGTEQMGYALGSPLYINVLKKAYDYIVANYNVHEKIFAHGTSMGGVGATAFSHTYPELVLAESSFAGREFLYYLVPIKNNDADERFAAAYGYENISALNADKFSHSEGAFPSLSIIKYVDGVAQIPPDRETAYSDWLTYYTQIADLTRDADAGVWIGKRSVPYKAWNSWADNVACTKLQTVLQKAYNRGNACPYYLVTYESGTHTEMSYGQINDMIPQLISWYKRWE